MGAMGETGLNRNTERKQNNSPDRSVAVVHVGHASTVMPVVTLTSPVLVTVVDGQLTTVRRPLAA